MLALEQQAQEKSPWIALAAAFLIVAAALSMTMLQPAGSQALDPVSEAHQQTSSGEYQSPQLCRECHQEEFQAWSGTIHAQASFDPIFQTYLQQVAEPGECLSCHTTGYDSNTGQFVLAGVTCEACHGPYRPQHPEESMKIASSEAMCGTCHTGTLAEWQSSQHGQVGVTCIDCHEVHTQKARTTENMNTLCTGCHESQTQDEIHRQHLQADVLCIDCHLSRPRENAGELVEGQATTGHSFYVYVNTCDDCHALSLESSLRPQAQ